MPGARAGMRRRRQPDPDGPGEPRGPVRRGRPVHPAGRRGPRDRLPPGARQHRAARHQHHRGRRPVRYVRLHRLPRGLLVGARAGPGQDPRGLLDPAEPARDRLPELQHLPRLACPRDGPRDDGLPRPEDDLGPRPRGEGPRAAGGGRPGPARPVRRLCPDPPDRGGVPPGRGRLVPLSRAPGGDQPPDLLLRDGRARAGEGPAVPRRGPHARVARQPAGRVPRAGRGLGRGPGVGRAVPRLPLQPDLPPDPVLPRRLRTSRGPFGRRGRVLLGRVQRRAGLEPSRTWPPTPPRSSAVPTARRA